MWKTMGLTIFLILGLSLTGCAGGGAGRAAQQGAVSRVSNTSAAVIPPLGVLYSRVRAPVTSDVPSRVGKRRGMATTRQIATPPIPGVAPAIPLVAWGDASMEEAAADGGIREVSHMDYRLTIILMFWRRFDLIVYGD